MIPVDAMDGHAVWTSLSFGLTAACVLTALCPSLLVIPILLLLGKRMRRAVSPRRYWIGLAVHGSAVLAFLATVAVLMAYAGEAGSAASFFVFLTAPVWWGLCLVGLVIALTGRKGDAAAA